MSQSVELVDVLLLGLLRLVQVVVMGCVTAVAIGLLVPSQTGRHSPAVLEQIQNDLYDLQYLIAFNSGSVNILHGYRFGVYLDWSIGNSYNRNVNTFFLIVPIQIECKVVLNNLDKYGLEYIEYSLNEMRREWRQLRVSLLGLSVSG